MKSKAKELINKKVPRIIFLIFLDTLALVTTAFLSLWLRFDFHEIPHEFLANVAHCLPVDFIFMVVIFSGFHLYTSVWRYASISELLSIITGCVWVELLSTAFKALLQLQIPRAHFFIHLILMILSAAAIRYSYRILRFILHSLQARKGSRIIMVIGGGDAAKILIDEYSRSDKNYDARIACIIDDDRSKVGSVIRGVPIVGNRQTIEYNAYKYHINEIIIAIPSASKENISKIVTECQKTDCKINILPAIYLQSDQETENVTEYIRPIKYEDFLGRDQIVVNNQEITDNLTGKTILVTGGGGSIGSELCRQIAAAKPKLLIIFDIYENNAYDIQQELYRNYPDLNLETIIGSVRDYARLEKVFEEFLPDQVYHAAAHKHVPLMEVSPNEAIKNNCLGTLNTVKLANMYGVEKFVLVSTDKAVRPTNIMGASKRICEMIIQTWDKFSTTSFVAVRFGNVLGSNGSVIPLFLKQIESGGPVTVTHKDITRYFMTIPEAVSLILQAGVYAEGGEIFVLDMGKPVKIYDLAKKIIRYKGLEPGKDIQIKITGLRPGEKLYEEMLMEEEGLKETPNKLIHIGRPIRIKDTFQEDLDNLIDAAERNSPAIKQLTAKLVTTYKPAKEEK